MTDHFARPERAATPAEQRVAELHRLANADYASAALRRAANPTWPANPPRAIPAPLYGAALDLRDQPHDEPTDLQVAVGVAQRMLDSDEILSVREALRLLLRALGAEPEIPLPADPPPPVITTPNGPGCGAVSTTRIEGYSASEKRLHGSLDLAVYACDEHAAEARTQWLAGFTPYSSPSYMARCGDRFDYRTLDGGQ
ncbi:hypothetical protein ACFUCH_03725 [Streptomyces olivaceus]|uniref:hypothetical protein n=1 Tax=Streptomyces olivaceus TaxID=47716 RepID=UPI003635FE7A